MFGLTFVLVFGLAFVLVFGSVFVGRCVHLLGEVDHGVWLLLLDDLRNRVRVRVRVGVGVSVGVRVSCSSLINC